MSPLLALRRDRTAGSNKGLRRGALVAAGAIGAGTVAGRRRGYSVGGKAIVRCRQGHLFTTIWIPFASIKAIRLGKRRFQRCPVGPHWTLVELVKPSSLSDEERQIAAQHRDIRLP